MCYIGFTGHKHPRNDLHMLGKGYEWASSQMPINPMDYFYRSLQREVVSACLARDVGVIGLKCLGGGPRVAEIPAGRRRKSHKNHRLLGFPDRDSLGSFLLTFANG